MIRIRRVAVGLCVGHPDRLQPNMPKTLIRYTGAKAHLESLHVVLPETQPV
jgi:hypothetical protein